MIGYFYSLQRLNWIRSNRHINRLNLSDSIIKKLTSDREITVLISSHDLIHVTEVCERIVVLDKGEVVKDIKTSEATLSELEQHFAN